MLALLRFTKPELAGISQVIDHERRRFTSRAGRGRAKLRAYGAEHSRKMARHAAE